MNAPEERYWNRADVGWNTIFCAALQGFIANKDFFGPVSQGSPDAAVEFADRVVVAAIKAQHDFAEQPQ